MEDIKIHNREKSVHLEYESVLLKRNICIFFATKIWQHT